MGLALYSCHQAHQVSSEIYNEFQSITTNSCCVYKNRYLLKLVLFQEIFSELPI